MKVSGKILLCLCFIVETCGAQLNDGIHYPADNLRRDFATICAIDTIATLVSTADTFVPVTIGMSMCFLSNFTRVDTALIYNGSDSTYFMVNYFISANADKNGRLHYVIGKDGMRIPKVEISRRILNVQDEGALSLGCVVRLGKNSSITLLVTYSVNSTNVTHHHIICTIDQISK